MIKNYLVIVLYEVQEKLYGKAVTEDYRYLAELCLESFRKNLLGKYEIITIQGLAKTYHEVFRNKFYALREIHTSEECNIFYVDLDNFCIKETEIFGRFDQLELFCISADTGYRGVLDGAVPTERLQFTEPWFVTNVKYFPASMDKNLWMIGEEIVKDWVDTWAYECLVYNYMFHCQGIENMQSHHMPWYSYQAPVRGSYPNTIKFKEAKIIHLHSTRGAKKTIEVMNGWRRFL